MSGETSKHTYEYILVSYIKLFGKLNSNKPSKECFLQGIDLFFFDEFNEPENAFLEVFKKIFPRFTFVFHMILC